MIDISNETLLTFSQAARRLPPARLNRPTHVSTVTRWAFRGVGGVKLDASRIGGRWYTSVEALARFATALTEKKIPSPEPDRHPQSQGGHADQILDSIGY